MWQCLSILVCLTLLHPSQSEAQAKEVLDTSEVSDKVDSTQNLSKATSAIKGTVGDSGIGMQGEGANQPMAAAADTVKVPKVISLKTPLLSKLDLGGTVQIKGIYHNMNAEKDADKSLSLSMRRFKLELAGATDAHFGFKAGMLLDGNNKSYGVDDAFLFYTVNELVGFKAGKLNRPFSQEALTSSKSFYTIERGELYNHFLTAVNGYTQFDMGIMAYGGFVDEGRAVGYEVGIFNGKQNDDPTKDYSGQQNEAADKGFKAKDIVMRLTATPFKPLKLEAAVSTKAAEDKSDSADFEYNVNTAYELGFNLSLNQLKILGEIAWGDNHNKQDSKIISGSSRFFAFYTTAVWRSEYSRGRASELVLKVEGLDPDFEPGKGKGKPNDGKFRYTVGTNYFFTPRMSLMANYGGLQPITEVIGQKDWTHNIDVMGRLTF